MYICIYIYIYLFTYLLIYLWIYIYIYTLLLWKWDPKIMSERWSFGAVPGAHAGGPNRIGNAPARKAAGSPQN